MEGGTVKGLARMDCKQAIALMHDLLDDDLHQDNAFELKKHMVTCPDCRKRFYQLEEADRLLYSFNHRIQPVSDDLTERVICIIPKSKNAFMLWIKRHPACAIAAVFMLVILTCALSIWNADKQLIVKDIDLNEVMGKMMRSSYH